MSSAAKPDSHLTLTHWAQEPLAIRETGSDVVFFQIWRYRQADAMVRVLAVPAGATAWRPDGPHWRVSKPDVFFGREGAVYRIEDQMTGRLMPPVSLS